MVKIVGVARDNAVLASPGGDHDACVDDVVRTGMSAEGASCFGASFVEGSDRDAGYAEKPSESGLARCASPSLG
jgi:hypothetical protein